MTLLRDEAELDAIGMADDETSPEEEIDVVAAPSAWRWQRVVAIVLISVLGAVLTFELFTGPIERLWFRSRQSQLAADVKEPRGRVLPGQAIAVLQIPRLDVNVVVAEGDSSERLRSGPGHRIGTARPGRLGNAVVMGHRTAWGGPFGPLAKLKKNDFIAIQDKAEKTFVYRVRSIRTVGGGDTTLLRASKDHRLTLVTGRGGRFSDDRLIVTATSGRLAAGTATAGSMRAETPGPSLIFNLTLLAMLVAFGLAFATWLYLRHRARLAARIVVVVPLAMLGLLLLLLYLDLFLPPLH